MLQIGVYVSSYIKYFCGIPKHVQAWNKTLSCSMGFSASIVITQKLAISLAQDGKSGFAKLPGWLSFMKLNYTGNLLFS